MTFYCKPPTGNVGLDVVRRATVVRMQFLTEVLNCGKQLEKFKTLLARPRFSQNANYLMEGTSLDCMSYFLLRFSSYQSNDMIRNEKSFF